MNYTEQDIIEIVTQILNDIEYSYYENNSFSVEFKGEDDFDKRYGINKSWICVVDTHDWQFDTEEGGYIFSIDDDLPNSILLLDASGGQVPNYFIKKDENGKYYKEHAPRR